MLRNDVGARSRRPSPVARERLARPAGGAGRAASVTRAGRARAGTARRRGRAPGARSTTATWCSANASRQSPAARSRPSVETIRPSFIGYSSGCRSATSRGSRSNDGGVERWRPADGLLRDRRAPRRARRAAPSISARRGTREKPPTRTLTGWIGRPPSSATIRLPAFLRRSAALHDRRGGRAARSMRARVAQEVGRVEQVDVERVALDPLAAVEEAAQRADRRVDLDAEQALERVDRASSGRRPGRCRRCARRCR